MNRPLMWKLCWTIAAGTVALFWAVDVLINSTEQRMSYIDQAYQDELMALGREAEHILTTEGEQGLGAWLDVLQARENTWAAVLKADVGPIANSRIPEQYQANFRLGRSVEWKIHLDFEWNPIMDVTYEGGTFSERNLFLLVQLPQRMRPGMYIQYTRWILQLLLPFLLLTALALILYRHVMLPLKQLEKASRQFSLGNYDVRVKSCLGNRNDELAALAETFDGMTEKIGTLIITQRQLIADLSHELRTPLARIDMAVDCIEHDINADESMERLRKESSTMRHLVEDTLTLAWLENEKPSLNEEEVDLIELLDVLVEDARFEYSDREIITHFIDQAVLVKSSHRALAQAFENVIRNALKYTPKGGTVDLAVSERNDQFLVEIIDQGPGVPAEYKQDIFKPFFRVEKSRRGNHSEASSSTQTGGFGLGLALARRQIEAVGGSIIAVNCDELDACCGHDRGLKMRICLPLQ